MTNIVKSILVSAATLGACIAASSVSAGTIVEALGAWTFSASAPISPIPAKRLDPSNTYDFTFSWTGPEADAFLQSKAAGPTPVLQYQLFSGVPGAGGAFQAQSVERLGASITFNAQPGNYYAQVTPSEIKGVGALPSGVPEPATWALMAIGLGGLGAAIRARRALAATVA